MAGVVDRHRRGQSADAPEIHVDELAALQVERHLHVGERDDRFVEADRRPQRFLGHRVADQVVGHEGLLDHRQHEIVKPVESLHVGERHRSLDVDVERLGAKLVANVVDHLDVPPGAHLQFDPGKTGGESLAHRIDQFIDRLGPIERDSQFERGLFAAEQLVQGLFRLASLEVPPGRVEGRLGILIARKHLQLLLERGPGLDLAADQRRRQPIAEAGEGAARPLAAEGRRAGRCLAPTHQAAAPHAGDHRLQAVEHAHSSLLGAAEWNSGKVQVNRVDLHGIGLSCQHGGRRFRKRLVWRFTLWRRSMP